MVSISVGFDYFIWFLAFSHISYHQYFLVTGVQIADMEETN